MTPPPEKHPDKTEKPVKDCPNKIMTDSLGFHLEVGVRFDDRVGRGRHKTYEQDGVVKPAAPHTILISPHLRDAELVEVIAHEVYHLFYSIRHLIAVDEETEATVFGQLVKRILEMEAQ